ncbi:substrate-binding domain-containing protein [Microbacterium sp.]|uniref:substrate-binding domain-containing protein n=1 Tax=Microbacterium sp. TaxID=51671 RepID=UPI003A8758B5
MRSRERREVIMRLLREEGSVTVADLAERLEASPVSIRRDLADLADQGHARRVHGGAVAAEAPPVAPLGAEPPHPHLPHRNQPVIGVVVPTPGYYFARVLDGARLAARAAGVRLVLAVSDYDGERERAQIRSLVEVGARALIVTPVATPTTDPTTYDLLAGLDIPAVVMERPVDDAHHMLDCVRSDHGLGARLAFRHLLAAGHESVALITRPATATSRWLEASFDEFADQFDQTRSGIISVAVNDATAQYDPVEERAEAALTQCLEMGATAVLIHPDVEAISFAEQARDRGVDIPGSLSIVAYDDEFAGMADPPLDAISPPKDSVGSVTMSICLERIRTGARAAPAHVTLPPQLLTRGSVGPTVR